MAANFLNVAPSEADARGVQVAAAPGRQPGHVRRSASLSWIVLVQAIIFAMFIGGGLGVVEARCRR